MRTIKLASGPLRNRVIAEKLQKVEFVYYEQLQTVTKEKSRKKFFDAKKSLPQIRKVSIETLLPTGMVVSNCAGGWFRCGFRPNFLP